MAAGKGRRSFHGREARGFVLEVEEINPVGDPQETRGASPNATTQATAVGSGIGRVLGAVYAACPFSERRFMRHRPTRKCRLCGIGGGEEARNAASRGAFCRLGASERGRASATQPLEFAIAR